MSTFKFYALLATILALLGMSPVSYWYGGHNREKELKAAGKLKEAKAETQVVKYVTKREVVYVEREKIVVREPGLDDPLPPALAWLCFDAGLCERPAGLRPAKAGTADEAGVVPVGPGGTAESVR